VVLTGGIAYQISGLGRFCETVPRKLQILDWQFPDFYRCVGSRRQFRGQVSLENRCIRVRRLKFQFIDIASSNISTERSFDSGGESTLTRIGLWGIVR
jgi:hypothetical protein